jgi:hypothetical protein
MKVKKKKKEGKSNSERQAAKKPAYQPTLSTGLWGGGAAGTAAAGARELEAHTEQRKAKAHGRDSGCS